MSEQSLIQLTRISRTDYYESISEIKKRLEKDLIAPQISPEKLTKQLSENTITPKQTPIPDCRTCGACCFYSMIVPVANADPTPPENYWEITLEDSASEIVVGKYLKRIAPECNFLDGKLDETVACQIYEVRPHPCRDFEAGSDRCHAYRRLFNIEPPLTEEELRQANNKLSVNLFEEKITFVIITEKEITERIVQSAEGFFSERKTSLLQITAFLGDDETPHVVHNFNPDEETWLEDDFLTLTLNEAEELIKSASNL